MSCTEEQNSTYQSRATDGNAYHDQQKTNNWIDLHYNVLHFCSRRFYFCKTKIQTISGTNRQEHLPYYYSEWRLVPRSSSFLEIERKYERPSKNNLYQPACERLIRFFIPHHPHFPSNTMSSLASPPSLWISFCMFLTTLIVSWGKSCKIVPSRRPSLTAPLDAGYCFMRPRSLPGGDLSWIWKPYKWVYYLLWCNELTWISDFPYGEVSSAVQV